MDQPQVPDADVKTQARRRLLRGSFSVPAVLTLASGSALAVKSATCLAKTTKVVSTAPLVTSATSDTFLRVQLLRRPNSGGQHLVTRASFGSIPVSTSFWGSSITWQLFNVTSNTLTGSPETSAVPSNASLSSNPSYFVALRLNAQGNIVGLGGSGTGSVVGSSCWTSMQANPG